jgi:hypothetical protein
MEGTDMTDDQPGGIRPGAEIDAVVSADSGVGAAGVESAVETVAGAESGAGALWAKGPVEEVADAGAIVGAEAGVGVESDAGAASSESTVEAVADAEADSGVGAAGVASSVEAGTLPLRLQPQLQPLPQPLIQPQPEQPPQPLAPADRWRVAAVVLFNITGLGLGFALMRRWRASAACLLATGILLIVALPADANGVSGGVLIIYLIVLGLAAALGAVRARRTPLAWPRRPQLAVVLATALLAIPVVSVLFYQQAQAEAVQRMLLGRLSQADQVVAATAGEAFDTAQPQYSTAVAAYQDLLDNHRDSRAGRLVPARLTSFYQFVAVPYDTKNYCQAIAPLAYLRTLPQMLGTRDLGSLATWPDDRLATSLYQCGVSALGTSGDTTASTNLNQLLTTFPTSTQAAGVEPAVASAINTAAAAVNGSDPCTAAAQLTTLGTQSSALTSANASVAAALHKDADRAAAGVESGTFACGVAQYKKGDFTDALSTMNNFITSYPHDPNLALAKNFTIASQVAQQEPDAGKQLPTLASGGSISVTILNDSPDSMTMLYTGPDTGSVTIGSCGSCTTYSLLLTGQSYCSNSSIDYPQVTINLPPGTTYFLEQPASGLRTTPHAFSEKYDDGFSYLDCAYETLF